MTYSSNRSFHRFCQKRFDTTIYPKYMTNENSSHGRQVDSAYKNGPMIGQFADNIYVYLSTEELYLFSLY